MTSKMITYRISRFKLGVIDPPELAAYQVAAHEQMSVLDGLEKIRLQQEPNLVYRHSCHHGSCGTCACIINGTERLACTTRVSDLKSAVVTLEPLNGFERIADLAVSIDPLFQQISADWTYLRPLEPMEPMEKDGQAPQTGHSAGHRRFENCIECGSCVSACPVSQVESQFMGPAALAAIHRELLKSPAKAKELLKLAGGQRGERWCQRALACSRVCPTKVYPARHIADLRRKLQKK